MPRRTDRPQGDRAAAAAAILLRRALSALVVALALGSPPSAAYAATPLTCQAFADFPMPATRVPASPRFVARGEFHCSSASTLAVQVCAIRFLPGRPASRPIWCRYSIVKVRRHGKTFVRTSPHDCVPGYRYVSYVRILGHSWDRGPWQRCHAYP
jgi:hypothetical protein